MGYAIFRRAYGSAIIRFCAESLKPARRKASLRIRRRRSASTGVVSEPRLERPHVAIRWQVARTDQVLQRFERARVERHVREQLVPHVVALLKVEVGLARPLGRVGDQRVFREIFVSGLHRGADAVELVREQRLVHRRPLHHALVVARRRALPQHLRDLVPVVGLAGHRVHLVHEGGVGRRLQAEQRARARVHPQVRDPRVVLVDLLLGGARALARVGVAALKLRLRRGQVVQGGQRRRQERVGRRACPAPSPGAAR